MRATAVSRLVIRVLRSRVTAALVDQGAFSVQNFVVLFAALHWLDIGVLGRYTLISTFVILIQSSMRSLVLEPLTIRFSAAECRIHRHAVGSAAGLSLALGLIVAAICVACSLVVPGLGSLLPAAAFTLVVLVVQDAWRLGLLAARRTWATALNDAACLAATILGLLWLSIGSGEVTGSDVLLIWGSGTGVGLLLGALQLRVLPRIEWAWKWLRDQGDIGLRLVGSMLAQQLAGRMSLVIVAAIAGERALGEVSASRTLLTPLNTLVVATFSFAVPEAVRRLRLSVEALGSFTRLVSLSLVAVSTAFAAGLYLLPKSVGHLVAGSNWPVAHSLIIPTGLWITGTAMSQGARIGLRALERPGVILTVSAGLGPVLLICTTVGTVIGGGAGAAWGFGIASVLGQLPWAVAYRRAGVNRAHRRAESQRPHNPSQSNAAQPGLDAGSEVG